MYIVADIGGTKTRIAASRDLEKFGEPVIFETPQNYEDGLALISETILKAAGGEPIEAVAMGVPVLLSTDKRTIVDATNLPLWGNMQFASDVETRCGGRVFLENDVALVGLGEAIFGAGVGAGSVVYITVSTGVNGVLVQGGKIPPTIGLSIGRQYVSIAEPLSNWENMISGRAIASKYGMSPRELGKENVVWEELSRITAFGVHNAILFWTPDRVVLGGSMFNEIGIPVDRVATHVENIMTATRDIPQIVHSQLGDLGGLYGGLARLKQLD